MYGFIVFDFNHRVFLYGFTYDGQNHLTQAKYAERISTSNYTNTDRYTVSGITYDRNGNLKASQRRGYTGSTYGIIDQLTLNYSSTYDNRIVNVSEASNLTRGYTAPAASAQSHTYDNAGNLTANAAKGSGHVVVRMYGSTPRDVPAVQPYIVSAVRR